MWDWDFNTQFEEKKLTLFINYSLFFIKSMISIILSFTKASPFELIKTKSAFESCIILSSSFNELSILFFYLQNRHLYT